MRRVKNLSTIRQAKDFLAGRIAAEAGREGQPLSEIERKMLYFSETDWTLPDMPEISGEFDRDYDQDEYERKIGALVRKITAHGHGGNEEEQEKWDAAILKLAEGDHYLSVLADPSLRPRSSSVRPPHDILKLWLTGFAIVFGGIGVAAAGNGLFGSRFREVVDWFFGDRSHLALLALIGVAIWILWSIRDDLKIIMRGLLKRP
jgi:hypothetical protein